MQNPMRNLELVSKIQPYTQKRESRMERKSIKNKQFNTSNPAMFHLWDQDQDKLLCSDLIWKPKEVELTPLLGIKPEREKIHPWTARWS